MVRTTPDDDYDRKVLADVESHGWHLVGISNDDEGPAYVFSVGIFHTLGQPVICIFGLSSTKSMSQIINGIGDLMKSGQTFEDWHASGDVLDGYSCMFRRVDPALYREYFGYALWSTKALTSRCCNACGQIETIIIRGILASTLSRSPYWRQRLHGRSTKPRTLEF